MLDSITIDKASPVPIYKQLAEGIAALIDASALSDGDRLPTERELAQRFDVARGTVKKAYDCLRGRGLTDAVQGSGVFVSHTKTDMFSILESVLSRGEGTEKGGKTFVAAIECNGETLDIFRNQLSYMKNALIVPFLLEDALAFPNPGDVFGRFDYVFTTASHYDVLKKSIPIAENKLIKAVVSPCLETIVSISQIAGSACVGIFTQSRRFARIIRHNLSRFGITAHDADVLYAADAGAGAFQQFLADKTVLIAPPLFALRPAGDIYDALFDFCARGARIIIFDYKIETGSLIHLEEKLLSQM